MMYIRLDTVTGNEFLEQGQGNGQECKYRPACLADIFNLGKPFGPVDLDVEEGTFNVCLSIEKRKRSNGRPKMVRSMMVDDVTYTGKEGYLQLLNLCSAKTRKAINEAVRARGSFQRYSDGEF